MFSKTIWVTNGTEEDIDIQVTALQVNQGGIFRNAHTKEEIISRRATFIPGLTRRFWLPKPFNRAKVIVFIGNEIVQEETLSPGTTWTIMESSLKFPSNLIMRPIQVDIFIFIMGLYLGCGLVLIVVLVLI
jgi:hypothetical protein